MSRLFDLVSSLLGLLVLSPLLLVVAILVRLSSFGPVFYRPGRVGKDGKQFRLYKFRTMIPGASAVGPRLTTRDDPRVTAFGSWLRATKLDELPQLINVVLGDMSLVGPRPEDPRYVARYPAEYVGILSVRPGITSPASLRFRHEEQLLPAGDPEPVYLIDVLPLKLAMELEYQERRSFWSDLVVLWETLVALARGSRYSRSGGMR